MNRFQGISCLISKEILLVENTNFSNERPYRSVLLHENFQYFGLSAVHSDMIPINKIAYLLIFWKIHTKLGFYASDTVEKAVNRASFIWSNWSKNSPVETI